MKTIIFTVTVIIVSHANGFSQTAMSSANERILKEYFAGWANKDWDAVAATLAEGFTFTSAAPDDHIAVGKFKEKCWVQASHIERFEFPHIISKGNQTFAIVHVITTDGRTLRNVEYFNFDKGKIKSIEVFFGGNGKGFPTNE